MFDEIDIHTSDDSDEEAAAVPLAAAGSLRPGIVHRLDKGTTGEATVGSNNHTRTSAMKEILGLLAMRRVGKAGVGGGVGAGQVVLQCDHFRPSLCLLQQGAVKRRRACTADKSSVREEVDMAAGVVDRVDTTSSPTQPMPLKVDGNPCCSTAAMTHAL